MKTISFYIKYNRKKTYHQHDQLCLHNTLHINVHRPLVYTVMKENIKNLGIYL